jgi:Fe-S cluster assembly iron-binding protein IscA
MIITQPALEKIETLLSARAAFQIIVDGSNPDGFHVSFAINDFFTKFEEPDNIVWIESSPNIITDYESFVYLFDKQLDYNKQTNEFIVTQI